MHFSLLPLLSLLLSLLSLVRQSSPSWNQSAISRWALATESEPWQTLRQVSSPKSPRIVPGSDSEGSVAPSIVRACCTAFLPSHTYIHTVEIIENNHHFRVLKLIYYMCSLTIATTGPDDIKSIMF